MEAPQNTKFYGKMECFPHLAHLLTLNEQNKVNLEGGGLWAKHMGLKGGCYWEHPWGTYWEPDENLKRNKGKNERM